MATRSPRLSIDFGTSNTVAVLGQPDGSARPLLFDGSPTLRSAVFHDPTGGLLVGRDAEYAARTGPDRFEPYPKRRVDEPAVLLGDVEITVVELIAAVLSRVLAEATRVTGGPVPAVTLTYPAGWGPTRRQVLHNAAERAGISTVTLVPEPVAAADAFLAVVGGGVPDGAGVIVYDLGAGTFDVSVVRRGPGGFEVVAAEGLNQVGGLDLDAAIVAHLGAVHAERHPDAWARLLAPTTAEDRRASRLLWDDVRAAKEMLSRTSHTLIHVPLTGEDLPLGRPQFEQLARPLLDSTVTATRTALASARGGAPDIAGIFLVGGGSRIPLVATLLHQAFGRAPTITEQPELVVAEGGLHTVAGRARPPTAGLPAARHASMGTSPPPVSAQPAPAGTRPETVQSHTQSGPITFGTSVPVDRQTGPVTFETPASMTFGTPASMTFGTPVPVPFGTPVPFGMPPAPPRPAPAPRGGRTVLLVVGGVLALVAVVVAAIALVLRPDDEPRVQSVLEVNRTIVDTAGQSVTLRSIEVLTGKLRVKIRYENRAALPWSLVCPRRGIDLRSSYLTVPGRERVYAEDTWCTSKNSGRPVTIAAGGVLDSWGVFAHVPDRGTAFSLTWYDFPEVSGLTL